MYVVAPATPADAKGLLKTCIRDDNPILFVENVLLYNEKGEVPEGEHLVPLGKAEVRHEGEDITIIAYSSTVAMALQAADALAEAGVSAEVIDLRSLRPLDMPTVIESVKKTNHALIVTEGWRKYGPGAEIAAQIQEQAFDYLDHPVERITGVEVPLPYARELEDAALPKAEYVIEGARAIVGKA
jgi:pyruvate dehydrogenase E1 component beta subunit